MTFETSPSRSGRSSLDFSLRTDPSLTVPGFSFGGPLRNLELDRLRLPVNGDTRRRTTGRPPVTSTACLIPTAPGEPHPGTEGGPWTLLSLQFTSFDRIPWDREDGLGSDGGESTPTRRIWCVSGSWGAPERTWGCGSVVVRGRDLPDRGSLYEPVPFPILYGKEEVPGGTGEGRGGVSGSVRRGLYFPTEGYSGTVRWSSHRVVGV